jgi:hypothetical protein
LLQILLLCLAGHAQDYDDSDDDDTNAPDWAVLYLRFDQQGGASVDFTLPAKPANLDSFRLALAQSLHCPADHFVTPGVPSSAATMAGRWPAARRNQYLKQLSEYNQKRLTANCETVLPWNGFGRGGTLVYSSLARQLGGSGVQQLWIRIAHPAANHVE